MWWFDIRLLAMICLMLFVLLKSTKKSRFNISNFSLLFLDSQNLCTCIVSLSFNDLQDHFHFFMFFKIFSDITVRHYIHLIRPNGFFVTSGSCKKLMMMMMMMNWFFLIWLTDARYLTLFLARTFCQRSSPSQAGFGAEPEITSLSRMKLCICDNHYTTAS